MRNADEELKHYVDPLKRRRRRISSPADES